MVTFGSMSFLGDPLFNILGPIAGDTESPESLKIIEAAKAEYHLDKSVPEQWGALGMGFCAGRFWSAIQYHWSTAS